MGSLFRELAIVRRGARICVYPAAVNVIYPSRLAP